MLVLHFSQKKRAKTRHIKSLGPFLLPLSIECVYLDKVYTYCLFSKYKWMVLGGSSNCKLFRLGWYTSIQLKFSLLNLSYISKVFAINSFMKFCNESFLFSVSRSKKQGTASLILVDGFQLSGIETWYLPQSNSTFVRGDAFAFLALSK